MDSIQQGRPHELTPFAGQSARAGSGRAPGGEIVRSMTREAEQVLKRAAALRTG